MMIVGEIVHDLCHVHRAIEHIGFVTGTLLYTVCCVQCTVCSVYCVQCAVNTNIFTHSLNALRHALFNILYHALL